jgi:hypothetical protein
MFNVDRRYVRSIQAALYSIKVLGLEVQRKSFVKNMASNPEYVSGDSINVRAGTVAFLKVHNLVDYIEVTQMLTQGMSGGPLLGGSGEVVGSIHKGGPEEGRNFAVSIKMLKDWLEEQTFLQPQ